jgi:hypothetical protein
MSIKWERKELKQVILQGTFKVNILAKVRKGKAIDQTTKQPKVSILQGKG